MRKFWTCGGLLLAAALISSLMLGCVGKTTQQDEYMDPGQGGGAGAKMTPLEPAGKATLTGKVTFSGDRPSVPELDIKKDANECLNKTNYSWVIDGAGNVKNVFVWVRPADKDQFFNMEGAEQTWPSKVTVDQPACAFQPHCFLLYPGYRKLDKPREFKSSRQEFTVTNEMVIAHNASVEGPSSFSKFNQLIPAKSPGLEVPNVKPSMSSVYTISCTIHPWMKGYFWALDHPYAAVTKADGTFEIANIPVPKDGKMRVVVWHEEKQFVLEGKELGEEIELKPGKSETKNFSITK